MIRASLSMSSPHAFWITLYTGRVAQALVGELGGPFFSSGDIFGS